VQAEGRGEGMKKAIALIVTVLSCAPRPVQTGVPPAFSYATIAARKIAYAKPVVLSSEIFYENRFTDQSYHSIDKNRTQDAFFRDLRQRIGKAGLPWRQLGDQDDSLVQHSLSSVNEPIDSLPASLAGRLRADSADLVVLVYAVRLYHQQSIGLRPDKSGSVNSYTSIISKSLDYRCSIMDVTANRPVFHVAIKKIKNDNSLDFMESAIDDLFSVLLR
jgi:hypothetical protein